MSDDMWKEADFKTPMVYHPAAMREAEMGPKDLRRTLLGEHTFGNLRPVLEKTLMGIAEALRERSTCPGGRRHAAVIVVGGRPVAMGYNGPPRGWKPPEVCAMKADEHGKDFRHCPCVHAEVNAVVSAATSGVSVQGGEMYVTKRPCLACRLMLDNCGLRRIVYLEP